MMRSYKAEFSLTNCARQKCYLEREGAITTFL